MNMTASWRRRAHRWHRFFFTPVDPLPYDVIRIGYAALVLVSCLFTWPRVQMWYGESGVFPYWLSREILDPDAPMLFDLLPKSDTTASVGFGLLTGHALLLLIGVGSRLQALCVYVWMLSFHYRNPIILDAEDSVFRIIGFLLIFMPTGNRLSWDAWRRARSGKRLVTAPGWGLRLVQIEMCLVFGGCALSKLRGAVWLDGTAMYYVSRLDDYFGRFPTPDFFWESMTIVKWLGWSVIAVEALVPILVWCRETRGIALALAVTFHLGCDYCMNLYLFHWIMLVGWSSFLSAADWRWIAHRLGLIRPSLPVTEPVQPAVS